jgi:hypothetical protein
MLSPQLAIITQSILRHLALEVTVSTNSHKMYPVLQKSRMFFTILVGDQYPR